MDNKIQELTDKIYQEGVEKGNAEAVRIVEEAREKAAKMVADARSQAGEIEAQARAAATELKENTQSELKLYAARMVNTLKSEIATLVTNEVVKEAVKDAEKKELLYNFVIELARRWSVGEPIVISTPDAQALKAFFAAHAKELLDKGVTIEQVNGQKTQISIAPVSGAYKVNFGEEEFMNYFKSFLRPQMVDMLF